MKKCILFSSILIICIMPELSCVNEEKRPPIPIPDVNLPTIPKDNCEEKETHQLQYAQLLETHRSYFYNLMFAISIYLAVMGACLTVVCKGIVAMKKNRENVVKEYNEGSSKTILFILIFFAVAVSWLTIICLYFGAEDATRRNQQIEYVAGLIDVEPINVKLLENLFNWIIIGPVIVISAWYATLFRLLMECGWSYKWGKSYWLGILSAVVAIIWLGGHLLFSIRHIWNISSIWRMPKLNISLPIYTWIIICTTMIPMVWFLMWFIKGVRLARRQEVT